MSKPNFYSLNTKIVLLFLLLGLFLLAILFILIVPKMEKEQRDYTVQQIESMISLTNHQLKFAVKTLINHSKMREKKFDVMLKHELDKIQFQLKSNNDINELQNHILQSANVLSGDIYLINKDKETLFKTSDNDIEQSIKHKLIVDDWIKIQNQDKSVCPNRIKKLLYTSELQNTNNAIVVSYDLQKFNSTIPFEQTIKEDIQKSFSLTDSIHKGKIYLMWIDMQNGLNSTEPLYKSTDKYFNKKYCISKISNVDYPLTGLLTAKEILEAVDKEPILHILDSKKDQGNFIYPILTWVRSINNDPKRKLLFITSVYVKDIDNKIDSSFWKILPASLIALLFAIFLGYFLLKKLLNKITVLTSTAKMVNNGNMTLRSGIKAKDDIGILASTFDNMLDSIEKNINNLDHQVEIKTKELRTSLQERETLLKEIHHRVKNNLAMTISLIKLQKSKLKDKETQNVLTDIQERVYTMELLHRKLYESKDLSSIDFEKYVQDLLADLYTTYAKDKKIDLKIDIIDVSMDIEYALSCGLILNECVTNSFKYAFLDDKGTISVSLKKKENMYILKISDTGKGLPQDIDIYHSKTLGLKLIALIAQNQLLGEISYSNLDSSMFTIEFQYT